jgi:hypothetical protein
MTFAWHHPNYYKKIKREATSYKPQATSLKRQAAKLNLEPLRLIVDPQPQAASDKLKNLRALIKFHATSSERLD